MEKSIQYKPRKLCSLIEIDKLLKLKEDILEGFIKNIEDDISIITIIGSDKAETNNFFNEIIIYNYKKENEICNIDKNEYISTDSIQVYTHTFNSFLKKSKSKTMFFLVNCVDKKIFSSRLYFMLHTMSSIVIYNTVNTNLSEIEYISELKKYFSNYGTFDELIKSLSPKFIFVYYDHEKEDKIDKDKLKNILEKEDIISSSFVKSYFDKSYLCYSSLSNKFLDNLDEIITKSQLTKSFRGKRIEGLTLKHLIIELVNCINQNISFNISKM